MSITLSANDELANLKAAAAKTVEKYPQYAHYFDEGWTIGVVTKGIKFCSGDIPVKRGTRVIYKAAKKPNAIAAGTIWMGNMEYEVPPGYVKVEGV